MNHHCFNTDDDEQPQTLDAWLHRQRIELALMRALAHAQLDALIDKHEARLKLAAQVVYREVNELAQH